jgi:hypothetical protein
VQPVPQGSRIICTSQISKIEGRKMFMEAALRDLEEVAHYVDSTALFINMKPKHDSIVKSHQKEAFRDLRENSDPEKWNDGPRYTNLVKGIGLESGDIGF